jgi:hypothetical protein
MYTYIRCYAIAHNVGKQYKHSFNMYENFNSLRQNIVFAMNIIRTSHEAFARGLKACATVSKTDCHGTCGLVQRFLYTFRLYPSSAKAYTLKTEIYLSDLCPQKPGMQPSRRLGQYNRHRCRKHTAVLDQVCNLQRLLEDACSASFLIVSTTFSKLLCSKYRRGRTPRAVVHR